MLLSSVILVLREVLEAAILVSVLLAMSSNVRLRLRWLWISLPLATAGAFWFASALDEITDALDGAGQEVVNAGLQILIYLLTLGIVAISAGSTSLVSGAHRQSLQVLMGLAVSCALVREGSEIVIYIAGFAASEDLRTAIFTGGAIGAGIGVSLGILLYAALRALGPARSQRTCLLLLCFIGAGMVMQATMLLEQVDWLPAGKAVWDSSGLLSEQSIPGELLYAVFGYEATPSAIQLFLYVFSLITIAASWLLAARYRSAVDAA
jgi:high-affinity iron transporter